MTGKGPLQVRKGNSADRVAANPILASGEPYYDTETEGLYVGTGSEVGGHEALTAHRRRQLNGTVPVRHPEVPGAIPLWTCRSWQGNYGTVSGTTAGWSLPPQSGNAGQYCIGAGNLPGRSMKHGGWIQLYAHGRFNPNNANNNSLTCAVSLQIADGHIGPTWETAAEDIGWGMAEDEGDVFPGGSAVGDQNAVEAGWMLDVKIHALGWQTAVINPEGGSVKRFLAEGVFKMWRGDGLRGDGEDSAAGSITTKDVLHYFDRDHERDSEIALYAGTPRFSAGGTSTMTVWGSTAVLFCPSPGFEFFG